ncbi:unnamed protein product [Boreogadus saida]
MELQVLLERYDEEKDIITRKGNAKASATRRTKAWQRIADRKNKEPVDSYEVPNKEPVDSYEEVPNKEPVDSYEEVPNKEPMDSYEEVLT